MYDEDYRYKVATEPDLLRQPNSSVAYTTIWSLCQDCKVVLRSLRNLVRGL